MKTVRFLWKKVQLDTRYKLTRYSSLYAENGSSGEKKLNFKNVHVQKTKIHNNNNNNNN